MLRTMASQVFPLAVIPRAPANGIHLTPHLVLAALPGQPPRAQHAMTRNPARVRRASRPPGPARSWYATAGTAAAAAIVLLAFHTDSAITAAGLLAAAIAGTALAGGWRRSQRPHTADGAPFILAALILATALSVLLGVIMAGRPAR